MNKPGASGTPPIRVAAAVVWRDGQLLLTQRPPGGELGLMWEFPGGKIEPGETPEAALRREIAEELGVEASPGEVMNVTRHTYANGLSVEIVFVLCALTSHDFHTGREVREVRWVKPVDVHLDELLEADRDFMRELAARG